MVWFWVQLLCQLIWVLGSVFGAVMGAAIPFDFEGIDFLMTALFVTIVIDQWKRSTNHFPALLGFVSSIVFLFLVGAANFMLPTLVFTKVILTLSSPGKRRQRKRVPWNQSIARIRYLRILRTGHRIMMPLVQKAKEATGDSS